MCRVREGQLSRQKSYTRKAPEGRRWRVVQSPDVSEKVGDQGGFGSEGKGTVAWDGVRG